MLRRAGDAPEAAQAILDWLATGTSEAEIPFHPGRILMHDTTCVPALVDIAGMRSALAEAGGDPARLNPVPRVDVSVDNSVGVDHFGTPDALSRNMERNLERYRFMKWATRALKGVHVHPPGTGIMHTINLERLATVVTTEERDGVAWTMPDTLIGTDSHTPMINGIGVLAWGVGGLRYRSEGASLVSSRASATAWGSSRDWAAKGPGLLGVRAVLALSFERIHRSNLIGMGILPLRLPSSCSPEALVLKPGDTIAIAMPPEHLTPRTPVEVIVRRSSGETVTVQAVAAVETMLEVATLRSGSILPYILRRALVGEEAPVHGNTARAIFV